MLKLLKYELRKNRTAILILMALTLALEGYFLYGLSLQEEDSIHLLMASMGLMGVGYAALIYVRVVGVTSYAKEMKDRSAYLIFMTPNSGLKIMGSKYLFTLAVGLMFAALYGVLAVVDIALLADILSDMKTFLAEVDELLLQWGVHLDQFLLAALAIAVYGLLSIFSFFAIAYLSITIGHTLFRDKKWRGIASVGLFFLLNILVSEITGLLPNPMDELTYQESPAAIKIADAYGIQTTSTMEQVLLGLIPSAGVSLATILVSLFGCAWMLDKKVSL